MAGLAGVGGQSSSIDYFTDVLLRTNSQNSVNGNPAGASANSTSPVGEQPNGAAQNNATPNNSTQRDQVGRILLTVSGPNGLSSDDRTYLAQIVSAQAGISKDDAEHRVDDVVNRAKADATQAAETARKAAAYLSFWTFMSLLFSAVCATLGGILGGDLRDDFAVRQSITTSP